MRTLLKLTLMALGAGCTLLFAGGFPLLGAPAVYHGGAMLLLGMLVGVLALWGGLRLAKGQIARLAFGLFSCFMAGIGLVMVMRYGSKALDYAGIGGAMWFGAIGMGCIATVGLLFTSLFGFFAKKLMTARLWLAGAHVAAFFVLLGAYVDFCEEERALVRHEACRGAELTQVVTSGGVTRELPFRLRVDNFGTVSYSDEDSPSYSLARMSREHGGLQRLGAVEVQGEEFVFGEERWPMKDFMEKPGMLLAGKGRLVLRDPAPVRSYWANCHVKTLHRGREESRDEVLKVNEPLEVKGWQVTLMSYEYAGNVPVLTLQLRHAPGRFWALTGMLGLILCTACWCWQAEPAARKEVANA